MACNNVFRATCLVVKLPETEDKVAGSIDIAIVQLTPIEILPSMAHLQIAGVPLSNIK